MYELHLFTLGRGGSRLTERGQLPILGSGALPAARAKCYSPVSRVVFRLANPAIAGMCLRILNYAVGPSSHQDVRRASHGHASRPNRSSYAYTNVFAGLYGYQYYH